MLEIGQVRTRVIAALCAFAIGWWLVPSRVRILHEAHRFLPAHEYAHQYKKGSGPSIFKGQQVEFFWEVSPFDDDEAKATTLINPQSSAQQWSHFLMAPVTPNASKVPYIDQFVPPFFRKSDEFATLYRQFSMKQSETLPPQTKGVILLTYYRSGSSFVGQVLNQHPDVFYHFEPLYPFTRDCSSSNPAFKKTKIETVERILRCDMPNWRDHFMNTIPERPLLANDNICLHSGACFRTNSKALCNRYLCPPAPADRAPFPCGNCGPLNLNVADHICRKRKLTAMKTIRVCELDWMDGLMEAKDFELKVIHLIRDPRAVARSRLSIHPTISHEEITRNITNMCTLQMSSHSTYATSENYYYILYEDTNRVPFEKATEILEFLDLKPSHEVSAWITANTRKTRSRRRRRRDDDELDMGDFRLDEELNYDDKVVMIYKDEKGHSYKRTKYLNKEKPLEFNNSVDSPPSSAADKGTSTFVERKG